MAKATWYARVRWTPRRSSTRASLRPPRRRSTDEIEAVRVEYLGRKSALKHALREVRDRETGMALNAVRERLEAAIDGPRGRARARRARPPPDEERVDVTLPVGGDARGRLHLITQIRREVEDVFLGLGYRVVDGREVETTRYNFDALNFPAGHPARSPLATLFLDDETVLRTETSPSQIRTMEAQEPPIYIVSLGRVYRRDTPDATHSPIFHQVEGLAVDEGITLADLKGTLDFLFKALFGEERQDRVPDALLPVHRAVDRGVRLVPRLRRRRLPGLPPLRLDRGRRRRDGRPEAVRVRRLRPGALQRLRLRLGPRAHRDAAPRVPRPARALAQRPPLLEAVLSARAALLAARVRRDVDATADEIARRLDVSSLEVERVVDVGVADEGGNLVHFVVGRVVAAEKHPNADKLQLCQVDVGEGEPQQIVCGAWNFGVGRDRRGRAPRRAPARGSRARSTSGRSAASSRAG